MIKEEMVVPKVWRSELSRFILFIFLSVLSVKMSSMFPKSIVSGSIWEFSEFKLVLKLPLFWLLPMCAFFSALYRIYNVRYCIDARGIESRTGILALNQTITRIRFEDIRSIETQQSVLERILNVGLLEMSTAATAGVEMLLDGVDSPIALQKILQNERDARLRSATLEKEDPITQLQRVVNNV